MNETNSDIAVEEKVKIKKPSEYDVIVHNNDYTSYDEVILILSQAFELTHNDALEVATEVDSSGQGICGTYSKEVAEMKLVIVEMIKEHIIQLMPLRREQINILKFTIEKS